MSIFSSLTGLSYCDLMRFSEEHIIIDKNRESWLEMVRKKTVNTSALKFNVLLLPKALALISKYRNHPRSIQHGTIFPHYCIQTINRYLKIIVSMSNVKKRVTTNIFRHTFETTVTLENGVPMETVSHMLGHSSIRTTQIYSKVKKKKVEQDMQSLREKMSTVIF